MQSTNFILPNGRQEYTIIMQNIRYSFKGSVIVRVLLLKVSNNTSSAALLKQSLNYNLPQIIKTLPLLPKDIKHRGAIHSAVSNCHFFSAFSLFRNILVNIFTVRNIRSILSNITYDSFQIIKSKRNNLVVELL